jgi:hypothetical protein
MSAKQYLLVIVISSGVSVVGALFLFWLILYVQQGIPPYG